MVKCLLFVLFVLILIVRCWRWLLTTLENRAIARELALDDEISRLEALDRANRKEWFGQQR